MKSRSKLNLEAENLILKGILIQDGYVEATPSPKAKIFFSF